MNGANPKDTRSLGELVSSLFNDFSYLLKQELELAKSEMNEKVSSVSRNAVNLAIGASLLLVGTFALVATLILVLALFVPAWVASLIVSVSFLMVGGLIVLLASRKLRATSLAPERTLHTFRRTAQAIKEPLT